MPVLLERERVKGLPIGNLVSQLFANIYLHELDSFIKHELKVRYYLRYTDDFIIIHHDAVYLRALIAPIKKFLDERLKLRLHPRKILLRKLSQGIDFLGYVILPYHRALRTKTKHRMFRKVAIKIRQHRDGEISRKQLEETLQSYFGMLRFCRGRRLAVVLRHLGATGFPPARE